MHISVRLRNANLNLCEQRMMGNGCIPVIPRRSHISAKWLKEWCGGEGGRKGGREVTGGQRGHGGLSLRMILIYK